MILHEEKCFWLYEDISYLNTIGDKCFVFNAFKIFLCVEQPFCLKVLLVRKNIFESHFQMVKNFCRTGWSGRHLKLAVLDKLGMTERLSNTEHLLLMVYYSFRS